MSNYTPRISDISAKIKHVYIELRDYQFFHSPFSGEVKSDKDKKLDGRFIGREKVKTQIREILKSSKTKSGSYLVAGFRGMGKTSVVRMAIEEYNAAILGDQKGEKGKPRLSLIRKLLLIFTIVVNLCAFILCLNAVITPLIFSKRWPDLSGLATKFFIFILPSNIWLQLLIFLVPVFLFNVIMLALRDWALFGRRETLKTPQGFYKSFEINLSQDEIQEVDVLKRFTSELLSFWASLDRSNFEVYNRPIYAPFKWIRRFFLRPNGRKSLSTQYHNIFKRLNLLSQRISAQVTSENKIGFSPNFTVGRHLGIGRLATPLGGISKNERVIYPVANAKEIEDELINILEDIDTFRDSEALIKAEFYIPGFIFIIDELDKIEPHNTGNISERESSDPTFDPKDSFLTVDSLTRQRQESVARLLANLKGFLNVVRAKFFFIGGRELYDASLADIADRDSFYSSVFNRIIYVNSFFKDKVDQRAGITQMTETYLCKIILSDLKEHLVSGIGNSREIENRKYNLRTLYKKLHFEKNKLFLKDEEDTNLPSSFIEKLIKYKVIFLLQNFVIYLTYRSNGTPKKLAALTEKIITFNLPNDVNLEKDNLVVRHKANEPQKEGSRLFLRFKFDFQYEIGLTSYIYRPYLIVNSRHLKTFGDKLLFSSAFIFDHILKFHNYSFSWRNLELIPEVILVTKEPTLRQFIEELIHFLSKTQIRDTVSGINQYRFFNKIDTELSFLSKISDLSAAAFNFTLDESLHIKRHYKRKLQELQKKYQGYRPVKGDNQFIHSIAFVQNILGDLHYYDKEYDEALIYYNESIQTIRLPVSSNPLLTKHQFFIWLRSNLKAALTLEKMRAFESAFSYYASTCKEVSHYIDTVIFIDTVFHKSNTYRNIQMISMPYIAFLAVIEKNRNDGITYVNLKEKEVELRRILKLNERDQKPGYYREEIEENLGLDHYRKFLMMADFYNNVGSILFYKNCQYPMLFQERFYKVHLHYLPKNLKDFLNEIYENRSSKEYDFHPTLSPFIYFYLSAKYIVEYHRDRLSDLGAKVGLEDLSEDGCLQLVPMLLLPECTNFINSGRSYYLANVLSKLGDAVLGSLGPDSLTKFPKWKFLELIGHQKSKNVSRYIKLFSNQLSQRKNGPDFFSVKTVYCLYELAAAFYLRSSREQSFNYQYRKILYLVKDIFGYQLDCGIKVQGKDVIDIPSVEKIACKLFQTVTWFSEVSNRPQILKYREIFGIDNSDADRSLLYNNINSSPDIREIVLLVEKIRIRRDLILNSRGANHLDHLLGNFFISSYSSIDHRYVRQQELEYRSDLCRYVIERELSLKLLFRRDAKTAEIENKIEKLKKKVKNSLKNKLGIETLSNLELVEFLIRESIFCLREQIRSINIYGIGSFLSYSYTAFAHQHLGEWCQAYRNLLQLGDNKGGAFKEQVESMIGNNALAYLEPNFHFEQAIQFFYKAIQLHTEGRSYKENILNIYMLEDDYNDNLRHFVIGLERQRVNSGRIRRRISNLQKIIKNSRLYQYDSYYPVEE